MWKTGVFGHGRAQILERMREQVAFVVGERVPGHENGGERGTLDPVVMVWIYAHLVPLGGEGVFAMVKRTQLVMRLQLGPTPQSTVDDVRQTLAMRLLQI